MLPAIGQGVIVVEINSNNDSAKVICQKINHIATWKLIQLERAFVEYLDADCKTPLSAHAWYLDDNTIKAHFMLANPDKSIVFYNDCGNIDDAYNIGLEAAKKLKAYTS
jgi:hydroxymethylbilane synthase